MHVYSPFFTTLYDQREPVGNFGRGGHYSVLRATSWHQPHGGVSERPYHYDFGIIWDEDHDERVIPVVEEIYLAGLLSKFMFFGERKGIFTAVMHDYCAIDPDSPKLHEEISRIVENSIGNDWWQTDIEKFSTKEIAIGEAERVFHANIRMLWQLGGKPIPPRGQDEAETPPLPAPKAGSSSKAEEPLDMTMNTGTYRGTIPWPTKKSFSDGGVKMKPDKDNPGNLMGWGVYRNAPWAFAGLFATRDEAQAKAQGLGGSYKVGYGSHKPGTDDFIMSSAHQPE